MPEENITEITKEMFDEILEGVREEYKDATMSGNQLASITANRVFNKHGVKVNPLDYHGTYDDIGDWENRKTISWKQIKEEYETQEELKTVDRIAEHDKDTEKLLEEFNEFKKELETRFIFSLSLERLTEYKQIAEERLAELKKQIEEAEDDIAAANIHIGRLNAPEDWIFGNDILVLANGNDWEFGVKTYTKEMYFNRSMGGHMKSLSILINKKKDGKYDVGFEVTNVLEFKHMHDDTYEDMYKIIPTKLFGKVDEKSCYNYKKHDLDLETMKDVVLKAMLNADDLKEYYYDFAT